MSTSQWRGSRAGAVILRAEQFFAVITHRHDDRIDTRIQMLLANDAQWRLVARLTSSDRAHLLRVHDLLVARDCDDPDLLRAALLHDIGKADEHGSVRLWHRIARVSVSRLSPTLWRSLTGARHKLNGGLYLAANHARLGAALATAAGASERCTALIARHEQASPTGDAALDALIAADDEA